MPESQPFDNSSGKRRRSVNTRKRPTEGKVKTTIHLSREAAQRLAIHAAMTGTDRSALLESLITTHLRRYVVSDRGAKDHGGGADAEGAEGEG